MPRVIPGLEVAKPVNFVEVLEIVVEESFLCCPVGSTEFIRGSRC